MADKSIGLIISSMDSETVIELYRGIRDEAKELGYSTQGFVIYPSTESTPLYNEGEFYMFETVDFTKFDGLIVALNTISDIGVREKIRSRIVNSNLPMISIDCELKNSISIDNDNYYSVRRQFELLVDRFKRSKINYISGPHENEESNERLRAYMDCMKEHGFSTDGRVFEGTFYVQDGKNALEYFNKHFSGKNFDAIMCGNDMMAISTYVELTNQGIKVPEDVVITGYDAITEVETMPIMSIRRDNYEVGKKAIDVLKQVFEGKKVEDKQIVSATITNEECLQEGEVKKIDSWEHSSFVALKSMHAITRGFVEESTQCQNFHDYLKVLKKFIERLNPEFFQLVIRGEYAELFEIQDLSMMDIVLPDGSQFEMINAIIYEDGKFKDDLFEINENDFNYMIFDSMKVDGEVNQDEMWKMITHMMPVRQSLNTPLHFLERQFGYVSFAGTEFPIIEGAYWDWIVSLNYTMNNVHNVMTSMQINMTDAITGLYNRLGLKYFSEKFLERSVQRREDMAFLFFDLNNLKNINDNYGHEKGDVAIKLVADTINEFATTKIKGFRFGGDEFVVMALDYDENQIVSLMKDMELKLNENTRAAQLEFDVSASVGYSTRPWSSTDSIDASIEFADKMMYEKKTERKKLGL